MPITLQDVARKAGVSAKTVSRVVNNDKEISEETRGRVRKIIEEMGYVPHEQARRLAAGKTRSITLHFPLAHPDQIANPLELNFVLGTAVGAAEANYFFSLLTSPMTPTGLRQLTRGAQADGVILMQIDMDDTRINFLREQDYPFVMIGRPENSDGLSFIDLDFEGAIDAAFSHLVELGHREIGFLTYPAHQRIRGFGPAVRSMQGFERTVHKYNLPNIAREVDFSLEEAYVAALDMMKSRPTMSAIVTTYHTMSIGVLKALQTLGRRVPDNFSVLAVGVDREVELVIPPLTSIEWATKDAGYRAAKMLIQLIEGLNASPEQILVPPKLVVRESTGLYRP